MAAIVAPTPPEVAASIAFRGSAADQENLAESERWLSMIGGGLLAAYGLREGSLLGLGLGVAGGALIYRGLSGHCSLYSALHLSTKQHGFQAAVGAERGVKAILVAGVDARSRAE